MPAPRITVVGSINIDLTARTPSLPAPGETVLGTTFAAVPGGKGANQAIAAAHAGGSVTFVGAVGRDTFAPDLRAALVAADVDTDRLREVDGPSGVALITVDEAGENSIVVVAGANATLTEPTDADIAVLDRTDVLLSQLEIPLDMVISSARRVHGRGGLVVLNPSPVRALPPELLESVDVLVVNDAEHRHLGHTVTDRIAHVVTTLGPDGAEYRGPDGATITTAAPRVEAVDTTGAGDAFTGALAVAWADGPHAAILRACAAGALATTRAGAGSSAPAAAEIDRLLGTHV